ncbi:MAG: hypothetical protein ACRDCT_07575, partial [Shewanella sp.]
MKKYAFLLVMMLQTACTTTPTIPTQIDVYKSDGSRQCQKENENTSGSLMNMQNQLANIHVYAAHKDYLRNVMFPTVCGGSTGSVNVYTINSTDLAKAQQRGFQL